MKQGLYKYVDGKFVYVSPVKDSVTKTQVFLTILAFGSVLVLFYLAFLASGGN